VLGHEISRTECDACRRARDDLCERFFALNRLKGVLYVTMATDAK
jgi:hypothetical protein